MTNSFWKSETEHQEYLAMESKQQKIITDKFNQNSEQNAIEATIKTWLESDANNLKEILVVLKTVPRLIYETYRISIARKAGIRASALDEIARPSKSDKNLSDNLCAVEDEVYPEAVCGEFLFNEIYFEIKKYVIISEACIVASALWASFAYALDAFDTNPRLFISGPEKRCGKTTLLTIISALVPKKLPASNTTVSAIFRAIDLWHPTLIIDEADSFAKDNEELRGILNSGHTPSQAYVLRVVGENLEPKQFSTWAPIAMAGIGRVWDTLEDRSIVIALQRKTPVEKVERLRSSTIGQNLKIIRQKLLRWSKDNLEMLRESDPLIPDSLSDREADNWRPLLAIADLMGVGEKAREAAITLSAESSSDESIKIKLLQDLKALFTETDRWHTSDLIESLAKIESSPWGDWKGKAITPQSLANLLKPFGIKPKQLYLNGINKNGYEVNDFTNTFARYLSDLDSRDSRTINTEIIDTLESRTERQGDKQLREPGDDDLNEMGEKVPF